MTANRGLLVLWLQNGYVESVCVTDAQIPITIGIQITILANLAIRFEVWIFDLKDRYLIWNICDSIQPGFKSQQISYFVTDARLSAQNI